MRKCAASALCSSIALAVALLSPCAANAQAAPPTDDPRATQDDAASSSEIVVTAQKREERLIDTPLSITVLSDESLARTGSQTFRDFADTVPALTYTTDGGARQRVSLRGVTVGNDLAATVGIYVDEVPQTSSGPFSSSGNLPFDVGLFDIERVEVLRGPQGTLYGASALGGVIRYITKAPDLNEFGGSARAGISSTRFGGIGYSASGVVNVPLVQDRVALRASAFESHDGGYIDNVFLGDRNANTGDTYGGRLDLLLQPTDALRVRIVGFAQEVDRQGKATVDYTALGVPQFGSLGQSRRIPEWIRQSFRLISGTVSYDFGPAELTSITSYQTTENDALSDFSPQFIPVTSRCNPGLCRNYSAIGARTPFSTKRFVEEVRLASTGSGPIDWLVGGYFTDDRTITNQYLVLYGQDGTEQPNDVFTFYSPSRYREISGFANLTWHLTDKLEVSGGIRYAESRQRYVQTGTGAFGTSVPASRSRENATTYLANVKYEFSPHATAYLRYATGFQPGGPNSISVDPNTGQTFGDPSFGPSNLRSYEAGFKGETSDRTFGIDVAAYHIDWTGIQLTVNRGGFNTIINAPDGATIDGAELTLTARPTREFTATGSFAYLDAEFSAANADLRVAAGERLPNVPRFTAAVTADYEAADSNLSPSFGATLRYVSDRPAAFGPTAYLLPDYVAVDLRAGIDIEPVKVQFYLRNLFDVRGQVSQLTFGGAPRVALIQPRTIGVDLRVDF